MSNGSIEKTTTVNVPNKPPAGGLSPKSPSSPIPRSASFNQLPPDSQLQKFPVRTDSVRRSFSENVLANGFANIVRRTSVKDEATTPSRSSSKRGSRRKSNHLVSKPETIVPTFELGDDQSTDDQLNPPAVKKTESIKIPEREKIKRSVSGSLSKFTRRRSWIGTSRSPSPSPSKPHPQNETATRENEGPVLAQPAAHPKSEDESITGPVHVYTNGITSKNSLRRKKSKRPLSSLLGRDTTFVNAPSVPPIPNSYSTETLPALKHQKSNLSEAPALPRSTSSERLHSLGIETPRKKDELWNVFRTLDGEYSKFQSRPSTTKIAVVRSALLPFLRNYANHPSISSLRPEDLDRRAVILNKWWTGLLEMLNGRYGESVSGNDRPAVLEAATALMVRPEWTASPPTARSRPLKGPRAASLKSRSTTSLASTMSEFLIDSVFHNVKNTFTQNLLAQMAYVVQKMSTRNVAASVVSFCGKATAWAFFYCEGVAAILVRLWAIPTDTLRRVLTEYGISRADKLDAISDRVCASFPPSIHPLALRSLQSTAKYLRSRPHLPIATANIPWHGPWVTRWAGRDTDLFFVFVKHFTELICRFMPEGLTSEEQLVSPGWALVQAQLLTVMFSTVQRPNGQQDRSIAPSPITFEGVLGETDATATMLPLPGSGLVRSMAENRLVMLLRDCLANSNSMANRTQCIFADVFDRLLRATARRTSLFDHNACFTLCDFLEEAIVILARYQQRPDSPESAFKWSFWVEVFQQMLQSQNSMTEVRLCAFLFSMWGTITKDDDTKREICLDWLLSRDTFQAQFCHWCPMVRAFYMRLLIWKVARPSQGSKTDETIAYALSNRLQEVWCHYLYLRNTAIEDGHATPSTAPCSPAPSRQLLIMRDDITAAPSGMFLSFDGILSSAGNPKANPYERHSSQKTNSQREALGSGTSKHEFGDPSGTGKKKWGLLKSINPFSGISGDKSSATSGRRGSLRPLSSPSDGSDSHPLSFEGMTHSTETPPVTPYRSLSFKFSLEWVEKGGQSFGKDRRLSPPTLPPLVEAYAKTRRPGIPSNRPSKPEGSAAGPSKYAGRAMAEWAFLVTECRNFYERRRAEGVPSLQLVEVPSLSVEPFRKM